MYLREGDVLVPTNSSRSGHTQVRFLGQRRSAKHNNKIVLRFEWLTPTIDHRTFDLTLEQFERSNWAFAA